MTKLCLYYYHVFSIAIYNNFPTYEDSVQDTAETESLIRSE